MAETPEGGIYLGYRYHLQKTGEPRPSNSGMPPKPAVTPYKEPEEPSIEARPVTFNNHTPSTTREPMEVPTRTVRERRPPSYLKDYICKFVSIDVNRDSVWFLWSR